MNKNLDWLGHIKVIGWDLDGTLYPSDPRMSEEIVRLRTKRVAEKLEVDESTAEFLFNKEKRFHSSTTDTLSYIGVSGEEFYVKIWDWLKLEDYIKPDPKVMEMFGRLRGKRHFLLSNSNTVEQIERKLKLIGVGLEVFEQMVSTVDVGVNKPDPKPFNVALSLMGADVKLEKVLYVGDRVETDVMGAKAAGLRSCLVGSESEEADVCVQRVYDVGDLFK